MTSIDFWFDPVSPYAYLAFERLPQALEGLSYEVRYRPILFAGLLKAWGQKGPAEIEPKRAWTFRQVHWLAHRHGIEIATPPQHPFNPLALLRLLHACAPRGGTPNRRACEAVLHHVWRGGLDPNDPVRLAALIDQLTNQRTNQLAQEPTHQPARELGDERAPRVAFDDAAVKQSLKDATAEALARGVFGVPTIEADGRLFWGLDALPMLADALRGDAWFAGPAWAEQGAARPGVTRG
jgi:2-hydroxychromene-2-carboxylate isomerase